MTIKNRQKGFGLIELMAATAIMIIAIMMCSDVFSIILSQSGQQIRVVSSEIESIAGLRMLRYDIEHAGYGLPETFQNPASINYAEAATVPASNYNDSSSGVPRGIMTGNNAGLNGSDYLVIKSTVTGTSDAAQRWTYIVQGSAPKVWNSAKLDLVDGSRVVVIKAESQNQLVMSGSTFFTQYAASGMTSAFSPQNLDDRYVVYGVDPSTNLRMPFNRADYYISQTNASPSCAPNTGILYKATVKHSDGTLDTMPIMDCVADMQIVFGRDTDLNGTVDAYTDDLGTSTATTIKQTVKEVRVFVLAQEGRRDSSYTHSPAIISLGDHGFVRSFNLSTTIGAGWQNYRWKVYTLVVKTKQYQQ